ncbi:hypothetical protein FN846DRAFT_718458 [Sphaerosporella brunnea]|uniref:Uncharacterized protein n=1 Tax=Sphaerosporella brunnea TaxID=1250544 RepID=A0A5J5EXE4_9PEZI|nr:hypothetical protein FN846DRAFT_718458 [Sphaerosporella brunnea]
MLRQPVADTYQHSSTHNDRICRTRFTTNTSSVTWTRFLEYLQAQIENQLRIYTFPVSYQTNSVKESYLKSLTKGTEEYNDYNNCKAVSHQCNQKLQIQSRNLVHCNMDPVADNKTQQPPGDIPSTATLRLTSRSRRCATVMSWTRSRIATPALLWARSRRWILRTRAMCFCTRPPESR